MTILSDASITELQALYKKETGQAISHEDAAEYGMRLILLVKALVEKTPSRAP